MSESDEKQRKLRQMGLHYCSYYKNLVRWNHDFCSRCPHNGRRTKSES